MTLYAKRILVVEDESVLANAVVEVMRLSFDANVDLADAVGLLRYLRGPGAPPACPRAGDVDGDGVVEIKDVMLLLQYLFDVNTGLPVHGQGDSPQACEPDDAV